MAERSPGNWNHLPHDPCAFFGLEAGFDRRQLKRAYGKLIRCYKPDAHPGEFQQIRQAYEQLESRHRYGHRQLAVSHDRAAWEAVVARTSADVARATGEVPRATSSRSSAEPSLTQRAIRQAETTFQELEQKKSKSPQEFFVLAVLADVCVRKDRARFLKCLLAGIRAHPQDPGLKEVLREYLRADVNSDQAPAALVATAAAVRADAFYELTEPLWERLLREKPFGHFRTTLGKCEKQLRLIDHRPRAVFYLRMLRGALWKADDKFIDRAFALIEKNGAELDGQSEYDLEFDLLVRDYLRKDRTHIRQQVVRQRLDTMVRDYCTSDGPSAAAAVALAQDEIARNGHGVMAEFSAIELMNDDGRDDGRLLQICMMIAEDVAIQMGVEYEVVPDTSFQALASATLNDMTESVVEVNTRINRMQRRILVPAFLGLVVAPPLLLWGILPGSVLLVLLVVWWTAGVLAYFLLLKPRYLDVVVQRRLERICLEGYEASWRPRLFRYLQSCGQPPSAALERLYETAQHLGADDWMSVVLSYPRVDAGLIIFGRAQVFVS